jgi:hypothetical protein
MSQRRRQFTAWVNRMLLGTPAEPLPAIQRLGRAGDDYEAIARRILRATPTIRFDVLIEQVAEEALAEELHRGGWASDVALWGPALFRREATAAVRRMVGRSLVLADDGGLLAALAA